MDDLTRQLSNSFAGIKLWLSNIWNNFYGYLVNSLGEGVAKMAIIIGAVALVLFFYFSLQNRD